MPQPAQLISVPKPSFCLKGPDDEFGKLTIHRASFPKWPSAQRPRLVVPYDHDLVGDMACEPMQAVTSQRHDYVSKNMSTADRSRRIMPIVNLACCDQCPMDSTTTTATAFRILMTARKRPSARPITAGCWIPENVPMATETEASASYRPWDPLSLYKHHGAFVYCRPDVAVNDCTVYSGSYRPPGVFRDPLPGEKQPAVRFSYCTEAPSNNNDGDTACIPFYPRAHDYNL